MRREDRYPETSTFVFYNRNPKGRLTEDCVIRAVSTATDFSYDRTLFEMAFISSDTGYAMSGSRCVDEYLKHYGWEKMKQPRHENGTKFTGDEFCKWLSTNYPDGELGNVVCNIGGNHMVAIKPTYRGSGINCRYKVHDTWNSTRGCIGNYWVKKRKGD